MVAEDAAKTDIKEQKEQFLRTVERLLKPSGKKETCHRRKKEKRTGMEKVRCQRDEMDEMTCCGKTFPAVGRLDTT